MEYPKVIQNWTHINDNLHPKRSRVFCQVLDIYTCVNYFFWDYDQSVSGDLQFTDLHVFARNLGNKELGFILLEKEKKIRISLGNLDDLPDAPSSINQEYKYSKDKIDNLKHIRLAIEYVTLISEGSNKVSNCDSSDDSYNDSKIFEWRGKWWDPQYRTSFGIIEETMPEFHLKSQKV